MQKQLQLLQSGEASMSRTAQLQRCLNVGLKGGSPQTAASTIGDPSRDLLLLHVPNTFI